MGSAVRTTSSPGDVVVAGVEYVGGDVVRLMAEMVLQRHSGSGEVNTR